MIIRAHRFHGRTALPSLYRQARTVRGAFMSIKYAPRRPGQPYRVAVVVSRKVSKSAVVRNRLRRRLYETVRGWESELVEPFDIVIMVYSDTLLSLETGKLHEQLSGLFVKAGILGGTTNDHGIVNLTGK